MHLKEIGTRVGDRDSVELDGKEGAERPIKKHA